MDQIEAARESNKKGSVVNRHAEANKAQLTAWNSKFLTNSTPGSYGILSTGLTAVSRRLEAYRDRCATGGPRLDNGRPEPSRSPG